MTITGVDLTFCLKETKAILQLADGTGSPMMLVIEEPGRPIVFRLRIYNLIEADFVVATAYDQGPSQSSSSQGTPSSRSGTSVHIQGAKEF